MFIYCERERSSFSASTFSFSRRSWSIVMLIFSFSGLIFISPVKSFRYLNYTTKKDKILTYPIKYDKILLNRTERSDIYEREKRFLCDRIYSWGCVFNIHRSIWYLFDSRIHLFDSGNASQCKTVQGNGNSRICLLYC